MLIVKGVNFVPKQIEQTLVPSRNRSKSFQVFHQGLLDILTQ
jgi:phenylacetate-coenzyme A ligase PaaK-like adenylate-forming protein